MNPEQFKIFLEENDKSTKAAVKLYVNGQITDLDKKLTDHIEKIEPFMQGYAGIQIVWKVFVAVGSLAIAYLAIKNVFKV